MLKTNAKICICSYLSVLLVCLSGACSHPRNREGNMRPSYFSLQKYFSSEAGRMQHHPFSLQKTIVLDGRTETRVVKQLNWAAEMDFFSSSDINKPAWLGKYRADSSAGLLTYSALDSSLKVRKISILRQAGTGSKIRRIAIHLVVQNFLYSLDEELLYIPDSLYSIERRQHIYLLGLKHYTITGKLSP